MTKKFKFWCNGTSTNPNFNKTGWWFYPNFILDKYFYGLDIFGSPDFEVCQWTGLVDKNGREIYEGDIIKFVNDNYPLNIVSWEGHKWVSTCNKEGYYSLQDFTHVANGKVIGNKFENPELLK